MRFEDDTPAPAPYVTSKATPPSPSYNDTLNVAQDQFSFHRGDLFGAPISASRSSEHYSRIKKALSKAYESVRPEVEMQILDLDRETESKLRFSALIVCVTSKVNPSLGVAYHVLVLEATGQKLDPIEEVTGNLRYQIQRVTSDAFDDTLKVMAADKVSRAYPNRVCLLADATVVPDTFNYDNENAVQRLAHNTAVACSTLLSMQVSEFQDLNLAKLAKDGQLYFNLQFARQQIENAVGQPTRSDVTIRFGSKKMSAAQNKNQIHAGDQEVTVSEINAFIDSVWSPVTPSGMNPYFNMGQVPTQKYTARMVITDLKSQYAYTPASVLLALMSSASLAENNNWYQAYRPVAMEDNKEIDLTDIGALNIEANSSNLPTGGVRVNTKSSTFTTSDLGAYISTLFRPGMFVSLDCPEIGPQSWYLNLFSMAANNNQTALNIILNSANQLTNGNFSKYFPAGSEVFVDKGNRVHLGTWLDRNGRLRDIRDFDTIAVANVIGESGADRIAQWSDTFLRTQYPLAARLHQRLAMLDVLSNNKMNITGFAQRVTFSMAFMEALIKGANECGFNPRVFTPFNSSEFDKQRGVANWANQALLPNSQFFQSGQAYNMNTTNYMGNFTGRY